MGRDKSASGSDRPVKGPCSSESYPNVSGFLPEAGATAPFSWDHTARCNTPKPDFEVTTMKYAPRFSAVCPRCNQNVPQGTFRFHTLLQLLNEAMLQLYCSSCDAEWEANEQQLGVIQLLITRPSAA